MTGNNYRISGGSLTSGLYLFLFILIFLNLNPYVIGQVPEKALEKACKLIEAKTALLKSTPEIVFDTVFNYKDSWIFERQNPESFVIVKKEKDYFIAGYSLQNKFLREGQIPEPGRLCLEAIQEADLKEFSERQRLKSFPSYINPLTTTRWGQDCYFNHACPTDYKGYCDHVPAGCIPVAMGQIMKYYGHLNKFVLEEKFESDNYPNETVILGNYDWDKMEDDPICIDHEVSKFLYHLGVITKVNYHYETTTTSTYNAWVAFGKLTYLASVRMVKSVTDPAVWVNEFYKNISEFMPVYVAGSGHAFVCDGYDEDGFFHFNLGWGGSANGYYPLVGTGAPFISEALMELRPHSLVLPPVNLRIQEGEERDSLVWSAHPFAETLPFKYRVYQDDKEFDETVKTSYPADVFEHGSHMIKVSAWYVNGESRWVGPVEVYNWGIEVTIPDEQLRKSMNYAIGIAENDLENHQPTADELLSIKNLQCTEPINNFQGIEFCRDLLGLGITDNQGHNFDLNKLKNNKKLKVLTINNAGIENLDLVGELDQLVYLSLNKVNINSLNFLSGNKDLLSLNLAENNLPATDSIVKLKILESLDLNSTGLADAPFINQLPGLKNIDLHNNKIEEFELDTRMNHLRFLNLNDNDIDEMKFIEELPELVHFRIANNRIPDLELFKTFDHLQLADLSGNEIHQIKINKIQPVLDKVDLSNNRITNIDRLVDFAPVLEWLDVSENEIPSLWDRSIQQLKFLDISGNKLTLIENIRLNPSLQQVKLSDNSVGDFFPLVHNNFHANIEMLDIARNPASRESYMEYFPLFEEMIDYAILPEDFSAASPSYPSPSRYENLGVEQVDLTWESDNSDGSFSYDVYFGEAGEMQLFADDIRDNYFSVHIDKDKRYQWQVVANSPDTSFSGGIYRFNTFTPIELPYYEGFETYYINDKISASSPYWITKADDYDPTDDGTIVGLRRLAGEKSLRIMGKAHLMLPIDNFSGRILNLETSILLEDGKIACIRLTEVSGIKLEVFFKINAFADVLINNEIRNSTRFSTGRWIPVKIILNGDKSYISIYIDGAGYRMDWKFPKGIVEIENIELSGESSPNFPSDGFPLYYIDEFIIREPGSTRSGYIEKNNDVLHVYPNPATSEIWISGNPDDRMKNLCLMDIRGQKVKELNFSSRHYPLRINISDLPPGIYWVNYQAEKGSGIAKIIITPNR